jgi:molybdate transport system substrate-binding protein
MKNKFGFLFLLFLFCGEVSAAKAPKEVSNLTIFSEPNMAYALTEIARKYSKENNTIISINFNNSYELIQNIDMGEPADIFIASHPSWIENLKQKGLVDVYNLTNIAKDRLVLVTSVKNDKINEKIINDSSSVADNLSLLSRNKVPLIIASEYNSLGLYTNKIIGGADINEQYLYRKINEDKKSISDFINENNEYCGIIMAAEASRQKNIKVLRVIPDVSIYYQALVIAGDNMEKARDFLKYLKSDEAKAVLVKEGFIVE